MPHTVRAFFAHLNIAAFDTQQLTIYHTVRQLTPRCIVNRLHRCACDPHLDGRLLLLQSLQINQTDDLIFIQSHRDRFTGTTHTARAKFPTSWQAAHAAAFFRSGHRLTVAMFTTVVVAMRGAVVPFPVMLMVAALDIRVILQRTGQERLYRCVCISLHAAEQTDIRFCQRHLCTAADTAADQRIHALRRKEACQRAMAAAIGIYDLRREDFPILRFIYFELSSVSKMLEDLAILISDCDFHGIAPPKFVSDICRL